LRKVVDEYITEGRYPGDLSFEQFGIGQAQEAIAAAETIEKFVLEKLAVADQENLQDISHLPTDPVPPASQ
jgi:hypothetical protein